MRIFQIVVVVFFILAGCVSVQAEQLVVNPGFETGNIDGPWIVAAQPVTIDSTVAHSGAYSVKMSAVTSFIYFTIPVTPGKEYRFSTWIKCENATSTLILSGLLNDPVNSSPKYISLGTRDWTNITYVFTAGVNISDGPVYFTLYGGSMGNLWIDDTTVTDTLISSLTGTINLMDYVGDITSIPVTIVQEGIENIVTNLNADGSFTLLDIDEGTYDVRIKGSHWLAKASYGNEVNGVCDIGIIDLINGDVVETNEVDFSDINAVRAAYGSFPGDETWNEQADVDGSGEVDFSDINIVRSKYGEIGE